MTLQELNYLDAANWVQGRCSEKIPSDELLAALHLLMNAAATAKADMVLSDLFPGSALEALLSRDDGKGLVLADLPPIPPVVNDSALRAIAEAISQEMENTGKQILTMSVQGIGEIVVFDPKQRSAVLMATKTTLMTA